MRACRLMGAVVVASISVGLPTGLKLVQAVTGSAPPFAAPLLSVTAATSSATTTTSSISTATSSTRTITSPTTTSPTTTSSTTTLPATTTTSPGLLAQELLGSAIGAANSQRAIDWTATVDGTETATEVGHAGRFDGTETVSAVGAGQRMQLDVVLIGKEAYFRANRAGLVGLLSFRSSAAKQEAGKWISVAPSDATLYVPLANGLTVSSATSVLDLVGALVELPRSFVDGRSVVGVRGKHGLDGVPVTQTVYIAASGPTLPVEVIVSMGPVRESVAFGPWGIPPAATAPRSAVTFEPSWLG